jgi:hypothetical protein
MQSHEFILWLKGFTEACHEFHPTPKQWDKLKEVLNQVEDYDDNPGLDLEIDDWYNVSDKIPGQPRDSYRPSSYIHSSGSTTSVLNTSVAWNDQMGTWHYTNYPEGFGYYHNKEKQQLND